MAIGTIKGLANAAQGRMAPRNIVMPEPVNVSADQAMARRAALAQSAAGVFASGKEVPTTANPVYSDVVTKATRAMGGLSDKGKYSGFSNAGDLQTAIEGAAISLGRTNTPAALRAKAEAFYNKIDPMFAEASKGPSRAFSQQGMTPMPSVDPRRQYSSQGYVGKVVNPSRQYASQLGDWYSQQTVPAENYLQSAQQLEATPLAALATQIATSAYGMNPDLAAGKFSNLDTKYYEQQRNAQSLAQYGVPYEQWKDMQAAEAKAQKAVPQQWATAIENTTGFKSSAMSALTAQTPEQMYATYSQEYTFKDPETGRENVANGQGIVDKMRQYLTSGETDFALKLADSLGQQDLARILNAMYNLGSTKNIRTKQTNAIYSGQ